MKVRNQIVVVTGAAGGIGKALAHRFHEEGAKLVVCSDIDGAGAKATAGQIGGLAIQTDVSKESDIKNLIDTVEKDHGPISLFCSNAGIGVPAVKRNAMCFLNTTKNNIIIVGRITIG